MQIVCPGCLQTYTPKVGDDRCTKCFTRPLPDGVIRTADRRTIADQCKMAHDPFKMAGEYAVYKNVLSDFRVVFIFDDRSSLAFTVSYTAAESGVSFL